MSPQTYAALKALVPRPVRDFARPFLRPRETGRTMRSFVISLLSRDHQVIWRNNLATEVAFWDGYFRSKGSNWPEDYLRRLDPNAPLQDNLVDALPLGEVSILDVGAGPLTVLGKQAPNRTIRLVAADPLAGQYDRLLAKYRVIPPVRTVNCSAENLGKRFGRDVFDLVYAQNCIDHCFDPVLAFREMVSVAKPGAAIITRHEENEGEKERYVGLHQWNFQERGGAFVIADRWGAIRDVSEALSDVAEVRCETLDGYITVHMRKLNVPRAR